MTFVLDYHPVTITTGRPTSRTQFWTVKPSQRSRWNRGFDRTVSVSAEPTDLLQNTGTWQIRLQDGQMYEPSQKAFLFSWIGIWFLLKQQSIMQSATPTVSQTHCAAKLNAKCTDGICVRSAAQKRRQGCSDAELELEQKYSLKHQIRKNEKYAPNTKKCTVRRHLMQSRSSLTIV